MSWTPISRKLGMSTAGVASGLYFTQYLADQRTQSSWLDFRLLSHSETIVSRLKPGEVWEMPCDFEVENDGVQLRYKQGQEITSDDLPLLRRCRNEASLRVRTWAKVSDMTRLASSTPEEKTWINRMDRLNTLRQKVMDPDSKETSLEDL